MNSSVRHFFGRIRLNELLVAALLLHALVPAGFMPGVDAHGRATLKLCASYAPVLHAADAEAPAGDDTRNPDGEDHAGYGPCAFAAGLHAALPSAGVAYVPPQLQTQLIPPVKSAPPYSALTPYARLARGPPTLA